MPELLASKLEKDVQKALISKKPTIFLGGSCEDNDWRVDIKKEFGDDFLFMDPYDKNWDPKDNVYDELAGIINAGWVVFYDGGKQSEREKDFIKNIGKSFKNVRSFTDLDKLKEFIQCLKAEKNKKACVSSVLRKYALLLDKEAMPWVHLNTGDVNLYFEHLDKDSINKIIGDFKQGARIRVPRMEIPGEGIVGPFWFSKHGLSEEDYNKALEYMSRFKDKPAGPHEFLTYNPETSTYIKKEAKAGVSYNNASTQVEIPEKIAQDIMSWGRDHIPDKDLYTVDEDKGREDEIHITLFYGITGDDPEKLKELISPIKPFECRLGLITAFKDKKEYDVLKIDAESPELIRLHYLIEGSIPNENSYPTYQPYCTIAYVKKGKANKFIGEEKFRDTIFKVQEIVFSNKDHKKIVIPLGK